MPSFSPAKRLSTLTRRGCVFASERPPDQVRLEIAQKNMCNLYRSAAERVAPTAYRLQPSHRRLQSATAGSRRARSLRYASKFEDRTSPRLRRRALDERQEESVRMSLRSESFLGGMRIGELQQHTKGILNMYSIPAESTRVQNNNMVEFIAKFGSTAFLSSRDLIITNASR